MVYTELVPRQQQFHVAPAMPALQVHHFGGKSKTRYEKLFSHVESHASAESAREQRTVLYKSDQQNQQDKICMQPLRQDGHRMGTHTPASAPWQGPKGISLAKLSQYHGR